MAALTIGDAGEDSGVGGDAPAVAVSGGVSSNVILETALVGVSHEIATGIEIQGVGGHHLILHDAESSSLSILTELFIFLVVLIAGGRL